MNMRWINCRPGLGCLMRKPYSPKRARKETAPNPLRTHISYKSQPCLLSLTCPPSQAFTPWVRNRLQLIISKHRRHRPTWKHSFPPRPRRPLRTAHDRAHATTSSAVANQSRETRRDVVLESPSGNGASRQHYHHRARFAAKDRDGNRLLPACGACDIKGRHGAMLAAVCASWFARTARAKANRTLMPCSVDDSIRFSRECSAWCRESLGLMADPAIRVADPRVIPT